MPLFGRSRASYGPRASRGCLAIFALPFAAVGVGMTWWTAQMLHEHRAMRSWVETPATVTKAELEEDHDAESGTTYRAVAEYQYEFGGRKYTGDRVSLDSGGDNIGSFQRAAYHELKRHLDQKRPFRCYVDPLEPGNSVLYRNLRWEMVAFKTIFATTFGAVGFGLMAGCLFAGWGPSEKKVAAVPADQPWLARSDWESGRVAESGNTASVAAKAFAVVTVYWFVASAPLMTVYPQILGAQNRDSLKWLTLLFPAIGLIAATAFGYHLRRLQKFGMSAFEMASVPGVVGGQLAGVVRIPRAVDPANGFRLRLSCIHQTRDSDGDSTEKMLWQDEIVVTQPMRDEASSQTVLPVLFAIPYESRETSPTTDTEPVGWRLEASAQVPGVNYRAQFDVPVFQTLESRSDFALDEKLSAEYGAGPDSETILRESGILREELLSGGVRLNFPAARNLGMVGVVTCVLAIWSAITWMTFHVGAPILLPIVFSALGAILLLVALDLWFYRSTLEATAEGITHYGGWLGIGRTRTFAAADIADLRPTQHMSSGTNVWTRIQLVTRAGKKRVIAKGLHGKLLERTVLEELNRGLGRNPSAVPVNA